METTNETETSSSAKAAADEPAGNTEKESATDKEPSFAKPSTDNPSFTEATADEPSFAEATADKRNETWEKNHKVISEELHRFMKRHERIPTKTELAEKTGLSRFTIHKHLKEYNSEAIVKQEEETFRMMRSTVLASMFNYAMYGDARAARVYFDVVDGRREVGCKK